MKDVQSICIDCSLGVRTFLGFTPCSPFSAFPPFPPFPPFLALPFVSPHSPGREGRYYDHVHLFQVSPTQEPHSRH